MSIKNDDNFIIYNLAINKLTTGDYEQALQLFEAVDNSDIVNYGISQYNIFSLKSNGGLQYIDIDESYEYFINACKNSNQKALHFYEIVLSADRGGLGFNNYELFIKIARDNILSSFQNNIIHPLINLIQCRYYYGIIKRFCSSNDVLYCYILKQCTNNKNVLAMFNKMGVLKNICKEKEIDYSKELNENELKSILTDELIPYLDVDEQEVYQWMCKISYQILSIAKDSKADDNLLSSTNIYDIVCAMYLLKKLTNFIPNYNIPGMNMMRKLLSEEDNERKIDIYSIFNKYGKDNVIKAITIYVISPYLQNIKEQDSILNHFAVEKFIRDQFDGMLLSLEKYPPYPYELNIFYENTFNKIKNRFMGALSEKEGFGIDDFNNDPLGPSQILLRFFEALSTAIDQNYYLIIEMKLEIMKEIYYLFTHGLFLPAPENYTLEEEFLINEYCADSCDYSNESNLFSNDDNYTKNQFKQWGKYFGDIVKKTYSIADRAKLREQIFSNLTKYLQIIKEINKQLNFIH